MSPQETKEVNKIASLTLVLRIIGAGLLFASVSTFMLQRWEAGNDVFRYFMLLGHTVVLCAFAFFCGLRINEGRGARIFMGLVLCSIPVHFAVLGGLLYSQFQWDSLASQVPLHALWVAPSAASALVTVAVGCAVLVPLGFISNLALARPHAKPLTIIYFLMNALILLPLRSADAIGIIVGICSIVVMKIDLRYFSSKAALNTREGYFIRLMIALPLVIIIGRSVNLYDLTMMFFGFICIGISFSLFLLTARLPGKITDRALFQSVFAVAAVVGIYLVVHGFTDSWHLSPQIIIPLYTLPSAAILLTMSFYSAGKGAGYRDLTALLLITAMSLNLYLYPSIVTTLVSLITSSIVAGYAAFVRNKFVLGTSGTYFLFGLCYHMYYTITDGTVANWVSLTVVGGALIIAASFFERNSVRILRYVEETRERFQERTSTE